MEKIPGGRGFGRSPEEFDSEQVKRGVEVEMEHTTDPAIALETALDHLAEDPIYYSKLAQIHDKSLGEIETQGYAISSGRSPIVRSRLPLNWTSEGRMKPAVRLIVESLLIEDQVTKAIMQQITRGILMRVGARDFVSGGYKPGEKGLVFTVTGKRGYLSKILVTLGPSDTYRVRAWRGKKPTYKDEWKYDVDGIYADVLPRVIEIAYKKLEPRK